MTTTISPEDQLAAGKISQRAVDDFQVRNGGFRPAFHGQTEAMAALPSYTPQDRGATNPLVIQTAQSIVAQQMFQKALWAINNPEAYQAELAGVMSQMMKWQR